MKMFRAIKFTLKTIWKAAKPTFLICLIAQIFIALSSVVNTITFKKIIDSANNQMENKGKYFDLYTIQAERYKRE